MSGSSPILGLFLPGGGSQNKFGPADPVDIDKINDNFARIDSSIGVVRAPTTSRPPNPFLNQVVYDTTLDYLIYWNGSAWSGFLPPRLSPTALAAAYYTKSDFSPASGAGPLDSRYFTQANLLNDGKLDSRYPNRNSTTPVISQAMLPFKIRWGSYTATTTAAARGFSDTTHVNFSNAFGGPPIVLMQPHSTATAEQHWGTANITASGFDAYYWRSDTTDITMDWIAIGN